MFFNWYNSFFRTILGYTLRGYYKVIRDKFLVFMLLCFFSVRVPYLFGFPGLFGFLIFWILPLVLALILTRVLSDFLGLISSFVPSGTPGFTVSFVCWLETIRFIIRFLVLFLRPFVNLGAGVMIMFRLSYSSLGLVWPVSIMFGVFFYECFIAMVHWYIVCNILSFSAK